MTLRRCGFACAAPRCASDGCVGRGGGLRCGARSNAPPCCWCWCWGTTDPGVNERGFATHLYATVPTSAPHTAHSTAYCVKYIMMQ